MRILHVICDLKPGSGGPPKVALDICKSLAKNGQHVSIFTTNLADEGLMDVPTSVAIESHGGTITYYPVGIFRKWPVSISLAKAVRDHLKSFDIVIIHGLYLFHTSMAAFFCRRQRIPYVICPHGTLDPFIRRRKRLLKSIYITLFEKRNLDYAAAVHYTAQEELDLAHGPLKIQSPGIVVPLGLELADYANLPPRGAFRARHPELEDKYIVLFLSRINFKKGLDLLAQAFAQIAAMRPDAHLVIAGPEDAGFGDQVRRWLADAGVLDRVTFTGMLHGQDKLAAFVDADQFVLPSYSENFGIALVEAMACGLPVITTNKVNIWKEISTAQAGEIIQCDAVELRDAILKIMDNPGLAKTYAINGKKLVADKFNWDVIGDQLISVYEKLIAENKKR